MKITKYLAAGFAALSLASCGSDYLDTEYTTYLDAQQAGEAAGRNPDAFLNGMWSFMVDWNCTGNSAHDDINYMSSLLCTDVMSEDIAFGGNHWFIYDYEFDNREYNYRRTLSIWTTYYTLISKANDIIAAYPEGGKTPSEKGLLGQALAMRGMCYTLLPQYYQTYMNENGTINREAAGVPLILTLADGYSLDELAALKGRNTVGAVLDQAGKDLEAAVENLSAGYERPKTDTGKTYIDLSVAQGLLARYYLLTQQWDKAAATAKAAHANYSERTQKTYNDGFMDVSASDVMWGFNHTSETQTAYASYFSHISNLAPGYAGLDYAAKLIDARLYSQIPANDIRKTVFNGPEGDSSQPTAGAKREYANLKFGNDGSWTMDYIYMRSAEMILIEAEALARQGKNAEAAVALKALLENRITGWNAPSVTVEDILLQRRIELWGEGFSYFDLKRNNKGVDRNYEGTNHLKGYEKVVPAFDKRWTYQLPNREIQENDLINEQDQNP